MAVTAISGSPLSVMIEITFERWSHDYNNARRLAAGVLVYLFTVLTNYADLLRKVSRSDEAAKLEARAARIRAGANSKKPN